MQKYWSSAKNMIGELRTRIYRILISVRIIKLYKNMEPGTQYDQIVLTLILEKKLWIFIYGQSILHVLFKPFGKANKCRLEDVSIWQTQNATIFLFIKMEHAHVIMIVIQVLAKENVTRQNLLKSRFLWPWFKIILH